MQIFVKKYRMQTLTLKINDSQNIDFLIELLSKFAFVEEIKTTSKEVRLNVSPEILPLRKTSGKPSIDDFAGIWQNTPKTLEQIRETAWKRVL